MFRLFAFPWFSLIRSDEVGGIPDTLNITHTDTIPKYVANYGITAETHNVTTADGYILQIFRLPQSHDAPVVFLQHGLLDSSWSWLDNDPRFALGIQLHQKGYDVWMGNNRGNLFSNQHQTLSPGHDKEFWEFSFHEMGTFDVPASIDYVLLMSKRKNLTYIGHSQGSGQFFSALVNPDQKLDLEQKVNAFIALAPVGYMKHQNVALYKVFGTLDLMALVARAYPYGFLAFDQVSAFGEFCCHLTGGAICKFGVNIACGTSAQDSTDSILNITAHFPAGTSVQAINHYEQLYRNGKFQAYDYGSKVNLRKYGQKSPPQFDLSQAAGVPTALFIGSDDDLADPLDANRLLGELPAENVVYSKTFEGFSHITWLAGVEAAFNQWFPDVTKLLQKYNPVNPAIQLV